MYIISFLVFNNPSSEFYSQFTDQSPVLNLIYTDKIYLGHVFWLLTFSLAYYKDV